MFCTSVGEKVVFLFICLQRKRDDAPLMQSRFGRECSRSCSERKVQRKAWASGTRHRCAGQKELSLLLLGNNVTNNRVIKSLSVVICVQSCQLVYMFCKQVRRSVFSLRSMLVHEVTTQERGWANRLGLGGCLISRGFSSPVITLIIDILKALH